MRSIVSSMSWGPSNPGWRDAARYTCSARVMSGSGQPPAASVARASSAAAGGGRHRASRCALVPVRTEWLVHPHLESAAHSSKAACQHGEPSPEADRMRGTCAAVLPAAAPGAAEVMAVRSANMAACQRCSSATWGGAGAGAGRECGSVEASAGCRKSTSLCSPRASATTQALPSTHAQSRSSCPGPRPSFLPRTPLQPQSHLIQCCRRARRHVAHRRRPQLRRLRLQRRQRPRRHGSFLRGEPLWAAGQRPQDASHPRLQRRQQRGRRGVSQPAGSPQQHWEGKGKGGGRWACAGGSDPASCAREAHNVSCPQSQPARPAAPPTCHLPRPQVVQARLHSCRRRRQRAGRGGVPERQ